MQSENIFRLKKTKAYCFLCHGHTFKLDKSYFWTAATKATAPVASWLQQKGDYSLNTEAKEWGETCCKLKYQWGPSPELETTLVKVPYLSCSPLDIHMGFRLGHSQEVWILYRSLSWDLAKAKHKKPTEALGSWAVTICVVGERKRFHGIQDGGRHYLIKPGFNILTV